MFFLKSEREKKEKKKKRKKEKRPFDTFVMRAIS